ncbi:MAG: L-lactate permease [Anaerolineae bacterium]|nr:L-lactate permease [Anaerolineae bacterium]
MQLTLVNWILASLPIAIILILMVVYRWNGVRAGAAGLLAAVVIALLVYGAGLDVILYAGGRAVLLTLDVLYIVWGALLFFQVVEHAGALRTIGGALPRLTADPVMQGLLLGWVFASFLQGVGGFGVPVAVVAPLLLSLGVSPLLAVVMPSLGHGWAVTFGSLGSSFQALQSSTGLPAETLAPWSAFLLALMGILSGAAVAHARAGWRGVQKGLPAVLIVGGVMGAVLYGVAVTPGLWPLGSTVAGLVGLAAAVIVARLPWYRAPANHDEPGNQRPNTGPALGWALAGYAVLLALTFTLKGVPAIKAFFSQTELVVSFPETATAPGWVNPAGPGRDIPIFGHAGAILFYASGLTYLVYRLKKYYPQDAARKIWRGTTGKAVQSSLGILAMVSMAVVMENAGMTDMLARGLSQSVGPALYPTVATAVGALGAFMTGSNTNSNVVFGALQMQTAALLQLSVPLILGLQTAAAAIGSIMAPTKLIVGASTGGMAGREGEVLRGVLARSAALLVILAVIASVISAAIT